MPPARTVRKGYDGPLGPLAFLGFDFRGMLNVGFFVMGPEGIYEF